MPTFIININLPFCYEVAADSLPEAIIEAESMAQWEMDKGCLPEAPETIFEHGSMYLKDKKDNISIVRESIPESPITIEKGAK